jgi:protein-S-isoprenylcysteine O-methyltransferase Ste14
MTREKGPMPPVIILIAILFQIALHKLLPIMIIFEKMYWIGIVAGFLGFFISTGSTLLFRINKTTMIPFQDSSFLITNGIYKYTRNPMYLGMLFVQFGIAIYFGSISPFIIPFLFIPIMNSRIIQHEELMLEKQFGESYMIFKNSVRRWI